MNKKIISVFGSGKRRISSEYYRLAYETGRVLAQAGFVIANGGYDGTMLAVGEGAHSAGGEVIGVTCSAFGRNGANKFVSREIVTENLDQRLDKLVELGQSYVVLPGGTGTLLELAKVWELKNKKFLPVEKEIIMISDFWRPLIEMMASGDTKCVGSVRLIEEPGQLSEFLFRD